MVGGSRCICVDDSKALRTGPRALVDWVAKEKGFREEVVEDAAVGWGEECHWSVSSSTGGAEREYDPLEESSMMSRVWPV